MPLPMGAFLDMAVQCWLITSTSDSSSNGCSFSMRRGRIFYLHFGTGYFDFPQDKGYLLLYEVGPGVAIWPTRHVNIHVEAAGFFGLLENSYDGSNFAAGAFVGLGVNYRFKSRPWAIGFDYRLQYVSNVTSETEHLNSSWGLHMFSISAILRHEFAGSN